MTKKFPERRPPFRECWCWLIPDLTKEDWRKVFRLQQKHILLLLTFFHGFILKCWAIPFTHSGHWEYQWSQNTFLLAHFQLFTCDHAVMCWVDYSESPRYCLCDFWPITFFCLFEPWGSHFGVCEENPSPFMFFWVSIMPLNSLPQNIRCLLNNTYKYMYFF